MEITRDGNTGNLAIKAGDRIGHIIKKRSSSSILFLVSGGSAFSVLDQIPTSCLGLNVTLGVLDERYSDDSSVNNFNIFKNLSFYDRAKDAGVSFIDTSVKLGEKIDDVTRRFKTDLYDWKQKHATGFVLITQGVGTDGHTAGIMPFPENPDLFKRVFEDKNIWVANYDAGDKNPYPHRITITIPFLLNVVDESIVYITGENKRKVLSSILNDDGLLSDMPARVIKKMKSISIYTNILK